MYLGFALVTAVPLGSEGDQGCIFFTLNTYQTTFISDISLQEMDIVSGHTNERTDKRTNGRTDGQTDVEVEIVI